MARQKYGCDLVVMSPRRLMTIKDKRECLEALCNSLPDNPLDRYGSIEPLRQRSLCEDLDSAVKEWDQWDQSLSWRTGKPILEGTLHAAWRPAFQHSSMSVSGRDADQSLTSLITCLDTASEHLTSDYSVLHVLGELDVQRGGYQGSGVVSALSLKPWDMMLFPTTHRLVGGLPDVYWSTVFGRPYVGLIGRERLLSSPEADVVEYEYGGIRITSRLPIHAARTSPDEFEDWRERVRDHVGHEFFFDAPAHGLSVRVPEFAWVD